MLRLIAEAFLFMRDIRRQSPHFAEAGSEHSVANHK